MIVRRMFIGGGLAVLGGCALDRPGGRSADAEFVAIRATLGAGARLGVAAVDTGDGRSLGFDADSRYAMASTFKVALAAAVLVRADDGRLSLDDPVPFGPADLVEYAPVVVANLGRGALSVRQLCAAVVEVSDNSAANLLLARIGGPAGLTAFIRRSGDGMTRLDRTEPTLNRNDVGDPRDSTTPLAMVSLMRTLLTGSVLKPASRAQLTGWMESSTTGRERLRAGLPESWRAGDKTGTGGRGAFNDIAIAWPPGRPPILIASYQSGGDAAKAIRDLAHARTARLVASRLG